MKNKKILITGGTGSLGSALVKRWYDNNQLTVLSRDPHKQATLGQIYPAVAFVLADICNESEVYRAALGQDILIHAAANKDVATGEYHPPEFTRVNIQGSLTVAKAWQMTRGQVGEDGFLAPEPRKALLISSDKAVSPLNLYGCSKSIAESIFRKYNYSVIRYGNVVESNGSFIHKWREAVAQGQPIRVREPDPTRFFMTLDQAIDLIESVLTCEPGIFVPHSLEAFSVAEVAAHFNASIIYHEPLTPYEKQHERLVAPGEVPVKETKLVSRIEPGWTKDYLKYQSDRARRVTGAEFVERILGRV